METVPRDVMTELSSGGASGATAHLHFKPVYGPIEFAPSLHLEAPLRVRLGLQQRAVTNLHNHVLRAVRRFAVLLVADLASFYVMREVVRVVRDYASFGDSLAGQLEGVLPHGILNGWQYAVALFVALFLTGNYGRGDQLRDPRRVLIARALATAPRWSRWPGSSATTASGRWWPRRSRRNRSCCRCRGRSRSQACSPSWCGGGGSR